MLTKLAFRNAKRSIRDYMIYIVTMTGIAALMYAFNTLLYCNQLMDMCTQSFVFAIMLGIATFFIVLIMAWLINYMVHFMLEKRSREFGTYLLIGMRKKQISVLYMKENAILGLVSFILGLLFGVVLQQILMTVFYTAFGDIYQLTMSFSIWCFLLTAACYFAAYLLAIHKNNKIFQKMQIIQFMHMDEEKEQIKKDKINIQKYLFILASVYLITFLLLVYRGNYQVIPTLAAIIGFVIAIYLFYIGASAYFISSFDKKKKSLYRHGKIFLYRQLSAKLKMMRFTFGTLTILFTCALLGGSVAMMFSSYQNKALEMQMPFDVLIYSNNAEDKFEEELRIIQRKAGIADQHIYQIFQNGSTKMNDYLYTHNPTIRKQYTNPDGTVNREMVKKDGYEYFDYDTYMKLSDYNRLRKMIGFDEIELAEGSYIIQTKDRIVPCLKEYQTQNNGMLQMNEKSLQLSQIITDPFSLNGNNGADYILVVPDQYISGMEPFFSQLAVSMENKTTMGLLKELQQIHNQKNGILSEEEFDRQQEEGKIGDDQVWDDCTLGGCGSDQIIACISDIMVSNEFGRDMKMAITAIVFPLAYIGLVFICVAFTILAVQQLSDSARFKFRYDILRKLGLKENELRKLVFHQLNLYYLMPVGMSVLLSGLIACFAGVQFVRYTGVNVNGLYFYGITLVMFIIVYVIYYAATYLGFCKNISQQR